jgi:hypothetical protein
VERAGLMSRSPRFDQVFWTGASIDGGVVDAAAGAVDE